MREVFRDDIIIFGALAGILGNIPKTILGWLFSIFGWVRYTFCHIAAGYFVDAKFLDNPVSLAAGFITDYIVAAFLGTIMYYLLRKTGAEYAELKGIFFGGLLYVVVFGTFMSLNLTRASLLTPLPNLLMFFPHAVYGIITCWILKKYGTRFNE